MCFTDRGLAVTALCACVIGAASGAAAQGRFELVGGDAVAAMRGLSIYTIRDNGAAACYTLFVLGAFDGDSSRNTVQQPALTTADLDKLRVADALREAAAIRDQRIAELRSSPSLGWTGAQLTFARDKIDNEYEATVRTVLPRLYPLAPIVPGLRSTSPDSLNEAVRQAIADADAVVTAAARVTADDQLLHVLNGITRSPRLAVAGPVACVPAASRTAIPAPR